MQLSEAILLGAMLRPQAFGKASGYQWRWPLKFQKTSCAFQAAIEAAHITGTPAISEGGVTMRGHVVEAGAVTCYLNVPDSWNRFMHTTVSCPACVTQQLTGWRMIPHLNDTHRWTRERIAAWVATTEQPAPRLLEHTPVVRERERCLVAS